jgi:hypothetical protein
MAAFRVEAYCVTWGVVTNITLLSLSDDALTLEYTPASPANAETLAQTCVSPSPAASDANPGHGHHRRRQLEHQQQQGDALEGAGDRLLQPGSTVPPEDDPYYYYYTSTYGNLTDVAYISFEVAFPPGTPQAVVDAAIASLNAALPLGSELSAFTIFVAKVRAGGGNGGVQVASALTHHQLPASPFPTPITLSATHTIGLAVATHPGLGPSATVPVPASTDGANPIWSSVLIGSLTAALLSVAIVFSVHMRRTAAAKRATGNAEGSASGTASASGAAGVKSPPKGPFLVSNANGSSSSGSRRVNNPLPAALSAALSSSSRPSTTASASASVSVSSATPSPARRSRSRIDPQAADSSAEPEPAAEEGAITIINPMRSAGSMHTSTSRRAVSSAAPPSAAVAAVTTIVEPEEEDELPGRDERQNSTAEDPQPLVPVVVGSGIGEASPISPARPATATSTTFTITNAPPMRSVSRARRQLQPSSHALATSATTARRRDNNDAAADEDDAAAEADNVQTMISTRAVFNPANAGFERG